MQNADYSIGPTLQIKNPSTTFFSQMPSTDEQLIKVRGPNILNRRFNWESRGEAPRAGG